MASLCPRCSTRTHQRLISHSILGRTKRRAIAEWQKRSFSIGQPHSYASMRQPRIRTAAVGSPKLNMLRAQERALKETDNLPEDVGLLPQTFVYPSGSRSRWDYQLRKTWARVTLGEVLTSLWAWWTLRPRPKFEIKRTASVAADLQTKMYDALSSGRTEQIESLVSPGLLKSIQGRIQERGDATPMSWSSEDIDKPKTLSFRIVLPPGQKQPRDKRSAVWQAVVRLHTKQTLQKYTEQKKRNASTGKIVIKPMPDGDPVTKKVLEYAVVQRFMNKGVLGPWKLWGFTRESNLDEFNAEVKRTARLASEQAAMRAKR